MEKNEVTLEDLKKKIDQVNLTVKTVVKSEKVKIALISGAVVLTAISFSYFLGKRRGRARVNRN
ncbi:MAG: hypothetical protein KAX16_00415 [Actinomycetia bacterium]|nr:hypothetical protein [Actinomycetes bacterium]